MSDDDRIDDILDQWDESGRTASPEDLCALNPDLLDEIRRRIEGIKQMAWMEKPLTDEADPDLEIPKQLGRYRLQELIGSGGFGQVWKGFDPELQRSVAIKVPRPDRPLSQNFLDEARKVAQLKHPGIVPVHDVGQDGQWAFIISDLVDGKNLAEVIQDEPPKPEEAARIARDVAEILAHAHDQGFVHRDVKPSNILLASEGRVFVTDFGIASVQGETESFVGTLAYMAPERFDGKADARSDIWSLGVVLYRLLSGLLPFDATESIRLREVIRSDEPKPLPKNIPSVLERICLKALAKDPSERYQSALQFAGELRKRPSPWARSFVAGLALLFILAGYWGYSGYRKSWQVVESETAHSSKVRDYALEAIEESTTVHVPTESPGSSTDSPARRFSIFDQRIDLTGQQVSEETFRAIARHPMLRRLVLSGTETKDSYLSYLRSSPLLEELDLSGTPIGDEGLKHLCGLPSLRSLRLASTAVSDEGMESVAQMRLREFDLSDTKITDSGLRNLMANHQGIAGFLIDLDLSRTTISDEGISHLTKLVRLGTLRLVETRITQEGIERLKKALPGCEVVVR